MSQIKRIFGDEKFITGENGNIESVIISISEYSKLVAILEDQKLGSYIKEAESESVLSKEDALRFLEIESSQ